jgi:SAM-dependent methyltransferase
MRKIPLVLVRCDPTLDEHACGLLQLSCSVPPEILYSTYWYRSGTNQTMRDHLREIVDEAVQMTRTDRPRVLDVGCNDGTLLSYYPSGYKAFGIDPSDAVDRVSEGVTVVRDSFPSEDLAQAAGRRPFDVITSIAMFYDLEDPIGFVRAVKQSLAPGGFWIFEMSYMPSMLAMTSYDTICHEHLEYYSLAVLEFILGRAGMKVFRTSLNDINGGSIRCYATHEDNFEFDDLKWREGMSRLRREEFDLRLDTDTPYADFQDRVNKHKEELTGLVTGYKRDGKRVHVYGASTKGNTILQFCGIDSSLIECAADRNPDKEGARTIGTDIPIVSEEESRAMMPDYYLVLPWHFKEEFLARERATLERGCAMIFPLPKVSVVTASSFEAVG